MVPHSGRRADNNGVDVADVQWIIVVRKFLVSVVNVNNYKPDRPQLGGYPEVHRVLAGA